MTIEQPSDPAGAARLPLLKKLFGRSLNRNIPPRIQAEIHRQDQSSELRHGAGVESDLELGHQ